jgi:hypothetical protein
MEIGISYTRFPPWAADRFCLVSFRTELFLFQFVSAYKLPLPIEPGFVSPFASGERAFKVEAINDRVDLAAGTRSLTLQITHPGLIWTGK